MASTCRQRASPRFSSAGSWALRRRQLSAIFGANSLGLFVGATFGGWLADRIGRRRVMIASMFLFGIFSIATALVASGSFLAEIRFLTGLGLGAALANIIALVAECSPPGKRSGRVMLITASHPLGGAIPGTIMTLFPSLDWRIIFHVGGWWPLLLAVAMVSWLPESPAFLAERSKEKSSSARPRLPLAARSSGRAGACDADAVGRILLLRARDTPHHQLVAVVAGKSGLFDARRRRSPLWHFLWVGRSEP